MTQSWKTSRAWMPFLFMSCRTCGDTQPVRRKDLRRSLQNVTESVSKLDRQVMISDAQDQSQILAHLYGVMSQIANIIQRIESSHENSSTKK